MRRAVIPDDRERASFRNRKYDSLMAEGVHGECGSFFYVALECDILMGSEQKIAMGSALVGDQNHMWSFPSTHFGN